MNRGFLSYFTTQLRRYLKGLPLILTVTVLILAAIGMIAFSYMKNRSESEEQNLATIGVVGDIEGSYLGIGISAIESLDASQYTVQFKYLTEDEADEALSSGEIPVYIIVPENFVEDISVGKEAKLRMVGRGSQGIGGMIINELTEVISVYLNSSETAIYAMQELAWDKGNMNAYGTTAEEFYMLEATIIFDRDSALEPTIVGVGKGSTFVGYYMCGIVLLFLLLLGISFSAIFIRQKVELQKVLYSQGVYPWMQVVAEYLCYLLVVLAITTVFVGIASALVALLDARMLDIKALADKSLDLKALLWSQVPREARWLTNVQIIWIVYLKWIPAIALTASLQYLVFELSDGIVSAVLAQFLMAIGLGFICGLFYPISFFPIPVQRVVAVLPVKAAMDYCQSALLWQVDVVHLLVVIMYAVAFIVIALLARRHKLKK